MSRFLITGGAGFIGSHLCETLVKHGHDVVVLDNLTTGSRENLTHLDLKFIEGDIRDQNAVHEAMEGADYVLHEAAFVSVPASMANPQECYETNVMGTVNVLEEARGNLVQAVVLASSAAVYGEADHPVKETELAEPISPYAASKLAMEAVARIYTSVYHLPTVSLRYFNVFGPRQSPDSPYAAAVPIFIRTMLAGKQVIVNGDGSQSRDFIYVDDVVRVNLLAITAQQAAGKAYNIASGRTTTINELIEILGELIPDAPSPVHGPAREGDIYFSEADISLAGEALGYRPEIALQDGLKATVQWFEGEESQKNI